MLSQTVYNLDAVHPQRGTRHRWAWVVTAVLTGAILAGLVNPCFGSASSQQKDLAERIATYRKAIERDPKDTKAYFGLGNALEETKDLPGAIAAFRQTIALDPRFAPAHNGLGHALYLTKDLNAAVAHFRTAIQLDPRFVEPYHNLGVVLHTMKRLDEAIAIYHKAIELQPDRVSTYFNLGILYTERRDLAKAVALYRKAIELQPTFAEAHCNLGMVLRQQGNLAEAVVALKQGHALGSKRPNWVFPSAQWLRESERLLELDRQLPKILRGEVQITDNAQRIELAQLCRYRQRYAAAARFYDEVLKVDAKQTKIHGYAAACVAALVGCGKGKDDPPPAEGDRGRWRQKALDWLRAALESMSRLADENPKNRALVSTKLRQWQTDFDLAGVRDKNALAQLPVAEQQAWQQLWSDVATLLKRSQQ